jgi:hypothetical protein
MESRRSASAVAAAATSQVLLIVLAVVLAGNDLSDFVPGPSRIEAVLDDGGLGLEEAGPGQGDVGRVGHPEPIEAVGPRPRPAPGRGSTAATTFDGVPLDADRPGEPVSSDAVTLSTTSTPAPGPQAGREAVPSTVTAEVGPAVASQASVSAPTTGAPPVEASSAGAGSGGAVSVVPASTVSASTAAASTGATSTVPTSTVPTSTVPISTVPASTSPWPALAGSATTTTIRGTAVPLTVPSRGPATVATDPPVTAQTTTTRASTSSSQDATTTTAERASSGGGVHGGAGLEAIRNTDPRFTRFASVRSADLDLGVLTEPATVRDNGTVGDGQFRAACQYSHFAADDPIVYPGQPGRSHLHMFFGNTAVDAFTTTRDLVDSGGGTCNGFELNRSGYWTPALLDGRGNAVVPEMIILYYKTKQPERVERMPQGLKMIAGNANRESFEASDFLFWSCGDSGRAYDKTNRIPDCGGDTINASIVFPQCWDGRNLDSADHRSHMALVSPHADCPSSHPIRLPQISILLYFPGQPSVDGWHLSSDHGGGFNTGPGATLHADWWGGWNDEAMDLWIDGCMVAARNCSFGQTGTDRVLAKLNPFQNYPGPYVLPLP